MTDPLPRFWFARVVIAAAVLDLLRLYEKRIHALQKLSDSQGAKASFHAQEQY